MDASIYFIILMNNSYCYVPVMIASPQGIICISLLMYKIYFILWIVMVFYFLEKKSVAAARKKMAPPGRGIAKAAGERSLYCGFL